MAGNSATDDGIMEYTPSITYKYSGGAGTQSAIVPGTAHGGTRTMDFGGNEGPASFGIHDTIHEAAAAMDDALDQHYDQLQQQ